MKERLVSAGEIFSDLKTSKQEMLSALTKGSQIDVEQLKTISEQIQAHEIKLGNVRGGMATDEEIKKHLVKEAKFENDRVQLGAQEQLSDKIKPESDIRQTIIDMENNLKECKELVKFLQTIYGNKEILQTRQEEDFNRYGINALSSNISTIQEAKKSAEGFGVGSELTDMLGKNIATMQTALTNKVRAEINAADSFDKLMAVSSGVKLMTDTNLLNDYTKKLNESFGGVLKASDGTFFEQLEKIHNANTRLASATPKNMTIPAETVANYQNKRNQLMQNLIDELSKNAGKDSAKSIQEKVADFSKFQQNLNKISLSLNPDEQTRINNIKQVLTQSIEERIDQLSSVELLNSNIRGDLETAAKQLKDPSIIDKLNEKIEAIQSVKFDDFTKACDEVVASNKTSVEKLTQITQLLSNYNALIGHESKKAMKLYGEKSQELVESATQELYKNAKDLFQNLNTRELIQDKAEKVFSGQKTGNLPEMPTWNKLSNNFNDLSEKVVLESVSSIKDLSAARLMVLQWIEVAGKALEQGDFYNSMAIYTRLASADFYYIFKEDERYGKFNLPKKQAQQYENMKAVFSEDKGFMALRNAIDAKSKGEGPCIPAFVMYVKDLDTDLQYANDDVKKENQAKMKLKQVFDDVISNPRNQFKQPKNYLELSPSDWKNYWAKFDEIKSKAANGSLDNIGIHLKVCGELQIRIISNPDFTKNYFEQERAFLSNWEKTSQLLGEDKYQEVFQAAATRTRRPDVWGEVWKKIDDKITHEILEGKKSVPEIETLIKEALIREGLKTTEIDGYVKHVKAAYEAVQKINQTTPLSLDDFKAAFSKQVRARSKQEDSLIELDKNMNHGYIERQFGNPKLIAAMDEFFKQKPQMTDPDVLKIFNNFEKAYREISDLSGQLKQFNSGDPLKDAEDILKFLQKDDNYKVIVNFSNAYNQLQCLSLGNDKAGIAIPCLREFLLQKEVINENDDLGITGIQFITKYDAHLKADGDFAKSFEVVKNEGEENGATKLWKGFSELGKAANAAKTSQFKFEKFEELKGGHGLQTSKLPTEVINTKMNKLSELIKHYDEKIAAKQQISVEERNILKNEIGELNEMLKAKLSGKVASASVTGDEKEDVARMTNNLVMLEQFASQNNIDIPVKIEQKEEKASESEKKEDKSRERIFSASAVENVQKVKEKVGQFRQRVLSIGKPSKKTKATEEAKEAEAKAKEAKVEQRLSVLEQQLSDAHALLSSEKDPQKLAAAQAQFVDSYRNYVYVYITKDPDFKAPSVTNMSQDVRTLFIDNYKAFNDLLKKNADPLNAITISGNISLDKLYMDYQAIVGPELLKKLADEVKKNDSQNLNPFYNALNDGLGVLASSTYKEQMAEIKSKIDELDSIHLGRTRAVRQGPSESAREKAVARAVEAKAQAAEERFQRNIEILTSDEGVDSLEQMLKIRDELHEDFQLIDKSKMSAEEIDEIDNLLKQLDEEIVSIRAEAAEENIDILTSDEVEEKAATKPSESIQDEQYRKEQGVQFSPKENRIKVERDALGQRIKMQMDALTKPPIDVDNFEENLNQIKDAINRARKASPTFCPPNYENFVIQLNKLAKNNENLARPVSEFQKDVKVNFDILLENRNEFPQQWDAFKAFSKTEILVDFSPAVDFVEKYQAFVDCEPSEKQARYADLYKALFKEPDGFIIGVEGMPNGETLKKQLEAFRGGQYPTEPAKIAVLNNALSGINNESVDSLQTKYINDFIPISKYNPPNSLHQFEIESVLKEACDGMIKTISQNFGMTPTEMRKVLANGIKYGIEANADAWKALSDKATEQRSPEAIEFLEAVVDYVRGPSDEKFLQIVNNFGLEGSPKEVNIDNVRKEILDIHQEILVEKYKVSEEDMAFQLQNDPNKGKGLSSSAKALFGISLDYNKARSKSPVAPWVTSNIMNPNQPAGTGNLHISRIPENVEKLPPNTKLLINVVKRGELAMVKMDFKKLREMGIEHRVIIMQDFNNKAVLPVLVTAALDEHQALISGGDVVKTCKAGRSRSIVTSMALHIKIAMEISVNTGHKDDLLKNHPEYKPYKDFIEYLQKNFSGVERLKLSDKAVAYNAALDYLLEQRHQIDIKRDMSKGKGKTILEVIDLMSHQTLADLSSPEGRKAFENRFIGEDNVRKLNISQLHSYKIIEQIGIKYERAGSVINKYLDQFLSADETQRINITDAMLNALREIKPKLKDTIINEINDEINELHERITKYDETGSFELKKANIVEDTEKEVGEILDSKTQSAIQPVQPQGKAEVQSHEKTPYILMEGFITNKNYAEKCEEHGLELDNTGFVFPSNNGHHEKNGKPVGLFEVKGGSGLAKVAKDLSSGGDKIPVLGLPTTNKLSTDKAKDLIKFNDLAEHAIEDLYRMRGFNPAFTPVLPVRSKIIHLTYVKGESLEEAQAKISKNKAANYPCCIEVNDEYYLLKDAKSDPVVLTGDALDGLFLKVDEEKGDFQVLKFTPEEKGYKDLCDKGMSACYFGHDQYFKVGEGENAQYFEPSFWGGVEKTPDSARATQYFTALKEYFEFLEKGGDLKNCPEKYKKAFEEGQAQAKLEVDQRDPVYLKQNEKPGIFDKVVALFKPSQLPATPEPQVEQVLESVSALADAAQEMADVGSKEDLNQAAEGVDEELKDMVAALEGMDIPDELLDEVTTVISKILDGAGEDLENKENEIQAKTRKVSPGDTLQALADMGAVKKNADGTVNLDEVEKLFIKIQHAEVYTQGAERSSAVKNAQKQSEKPAVNIYTFYNDAEYQSDDYKNKGATPEQWDVNLYNMSTGGGRNVIDQLGETHSSQLKAYENPLKVEQCPQSNVKVGIVQYKSKNGYWGRSEESQDQEATALLANGYEFENFSTQSIIDNKCPFIKFSPIVPGQTPFGAVEYNAALKRELFTQYKSDVAGQKPLYFDDEAYKAFIKQNLHNQISALLFAHQKEGRTENIQLNLTLPSLGEFAKLAGEFDIAKMLAPLAAQAYKEVFVELDKQQEQARSRNENGPYVASVRLSHPDLETEKKRGRAFEREAIEGVFGADTQKTPIAVGNISVSSTTKFVGDLEAKKGVHEAVFISGDPRSIGNEPTRATQEPGEFSNIFYGREIFVPLLNLFRVLNPANRFNQNRQNNPNLKPISEQDIPKHERNMETVNALLPEFKQQVDDELFDGFEGDTAQQFDLFIQMREMVNVSKPKLSTEDVANAGEDILSLGAKDQYADFNKAFKTLARNFGENKSAGITLQAYLEKQDKKTVLAMRKALRHIRKDARESENSEFFEALYTRVKEKAPTPFEVIKAGFKSLNAIFVSPKVIKQVTDEVELKAQMKNVDEISEMDEEGLSENDEREGIEVRQSVDIDEEEELKERQELNDKSDNSETSFSEEELSQPAPAKPTSPTPVRDATYFVKYSKLINDIKTPENAIAVYREMMKEYSRLRADKKMDPQLFADIKKEFEFKLQSILMNTVVISALGEAGTKYNELGSVDRFKNTNDTAELKIRFLSLISDNKDMDSAYAQHQQFEKNSDVKNKIDRLESILVDLDELEKELEQADEESIEENELDNEEEDQLLEELDELGIGMEEEQNKNNVVKDQVDPEVLKQLEDEYAALSGADLRRQPNQSEAAYIRSLTLTETAIINLEAQIKQEQKSAPDSLRLKELKDGVHELREKVTGARSTLGATVTMARNNEEGEYDSLNIAHVQGEKFESQAFKGPKTWVYDESEKNIKVADAEVKDQPYIKEQRARLDYIPTDAVQDDIQKIMIEKMVDRAIELFKPEKASDLNITAKPEAQGLMEHAQKYAEEKIAKMMEEKQAKAQKPEQEEELNNPEPKAPHN